MAGSDLLLVDLFRNKDLNTKMPQNQAFTYTATIISEEVKSVSLTM